ncbi:lantibiotic dehydratase [Oxalobacteraceae bacterium]|nr:lantibiotic dehydratase [Oxalobacteraceae bacterium]
MTWSSYFWMRSAGFPFERLDHLGVLVRSEPLRHYESQLAASAAAETALIAAARAQAPESLPKLERKFREGAPLKASELAEPLRAAGATLLDARAQAMQQAAQCKHGLDEMFQQETRQGRRQLLDFLATPEAREALFLSNPDALERIDALLERGADQIDSRTRQRLRLGWNYAQRLCSKNDTSSFFGPIAWGRFGAAERPAISVELGGPSWLAQRKTFFEHWVVLRLAQAMAADPALSAGMPITLSAGCHVEQGVLHYPAGKTRRLDPLGLAMFDTLAAAPQERLARADLLARLRDQGFDRKTMEALLDFLLAKTVLVAGFDVAPGSAQPLGQLRRELDALAVAGAARRPWLELLAALEAQRLAFAEGGLDARAAALDAIRVLLADAGVDLARAQGKMYVGRFPLYEDCSRNLRVELGGQLAASLKAELEPVMRLYDWLVGAVAVRLHDHYLDYWQLVPQDRQAGVDFLRFVSGLGQRDCRERVLAEVREILRQGWSQTVAPFQDDAEVPLDPAAIGQLLRFLHQREPRAAGFRVLGKHIHSPDFMLAARDLAAIEAGDYRLIIGEVHPAVHTVSQPVAQPFCPYAEEIRGEVQALLAPRTLVVADTPETYQRSHIDWLDVPALTRVLLPKGGTPAGGGRALRSGRGVVLLRDGVLSYRDGKDGAEQDLLTVMPSDMHRICFALAGELIGQSEPRRLLLGRMILKRRSWLIDGQHLPAGAEPGEQLDSYLAWRRWGEQQGLPRHVFVKCDSEPKPIYVDFCNPLALDLLAGLAKKKEAMRFSEMRPAPEELWLADGRGRYCSEFRTSYAGAADS